MGDYFSKTRAEKGANKPLFKMSLEKRDLIKDEIEKIGRMIGRIMEYMLGKNSEPDNIEFLKQATQQLQGTLDIDLENLLQSTNENFIDQVSTRFHHDEAAMDQFADLLLTFADKHKKRKKLFQAKARTLLVHIQDQSIVFSIDRQFKIEALPLDT